MGLSAVEKISPGGVPALIIREGVLGVRTFGNN
jgi:hypothetical protein